MAVQTIRQRGAPILGLIVNGVPIDNPYYYYTTYYYASYYHRPIKQDDTASIRRSPVQKKAGRSACACSALPCAIFRPPLCTYI
jgi:Mrp family chromosome partitioning ATPase